MCYRNSAITWSDRKSDRDVLTAQKVSQRSIGIEVNTQVLEDRACKAQETVRQRTYGQTGSQAEFLRPTEIQTKLRQEIRQKRRKPNDNHSHIPSFWRNHQSHHNIAVAEPSV